MSSPTCWKLFCVKCLLTSFCNVSAHEANKHMLRCELQRLLRRCLCQRFSDKLLRELLQFYWLPEWNVCIHEGDGNHRWIEESIFNFSYTQESWFVDKLAVPLMFYSFCISFSNYNNYNHNPSHTNNYYQSDNNSKQRKAAFVFTHSLSFHLVLV